MCSCRIGQPPFPFSRRSWHHSGCRSERILTDMGQNQGKGGGKKTGTLSRKKNSERNVIDGSGKLKDQPIFI